MIERFEHVKLAPRRHAQDCALIGAGLECDLINARNAPRARDADMVSQPVLKRAGGTLEEHLIENEVADPPVFLSWTNSRLFHRLGEGPQNWPLNDWQFHRPQSGTFPAADRGQNSWAFRFARHRRLIPQTNVIHCDALEVDSNLTVGKEDQWLNERALAIFAEGPLAQKKAFEPLAFAVRKNQRTVVALLSTVVFPHPVLGVSGDDTGAALDFDEEDPLRAGDQEIHFVDGAIIRHKLKIRPGYVGILRRETCVNKIERLLFPGEARRSNVLPVFLGHDSPPLLTRSPSGFSARTGNRPMGQCQAATAQVSAGVQKET